MDTIAVNLPADLSSFVKAGAAQTDCNTEGEYIAKLIERARDARHTLEASLIDGLNSGPPTEWTGADFAQMKQRLLERNKQGDPS
jgi:hypothetical protein